MTQRLGYWVDLFAVQLADSDSAGPAVSWIHALPLGTYQHPVHGQIAITPERVLRFAANVKAQVRGTDLDIDYDHKESTGEAAGWVRDAEARSDGLWLAVEWTRKAWQQVKDKAYRYFSPEFADEWTHPKTRETFQDVLFGGGLTNRPFLKDILPINFSELSLHNPTPPTNENIDPLAMEKDVDLQKLRQALGLGAEADEATVLAKLTELATAGPPGQPQSPPAGPGVHAPSSGNVRRTTELPTELATGLPAGVPAEIKALAEENPTIRNLVAHVEAQAAQLRESREALREAAVQRRLAEFDGAGTDIVLTPVAKDLAYEIAIELSDRLAEKFWTLLGMVRRSQTFAVELGERAGAVRKVGREQTAGAQFAELVQEKQTTGLSYADAVEAVGRENPQLYNEYREDTFAFRE